MMDLKTDFDKNGFVVIDSGLDESVLDAARSDLSKYFGDDREHPVRVPYADHNRIQDAWHMSQNVLAVAQAPSILSALESLYQKEARPFQTLNFYRGTQQPVHADNIHFNSEPFGAMCGVWTALEDIGPDQGALVYYPGSNKLAEMNYDTFGLEGDYESYPQYLGNLERIIEEHQFEPHYAMIKKGQSLVWAANTLHGGSLQNNMELTRHSQVTHYYLGEARFWRPSLSVGKRAYFKPDWVRDMSGERPVFPKKQWNIPPVIRSSPTLMRVLRAIKHRLPFV